MKGRVSPYSTVAERETARREYSRRYYIEHRRTSDRPPQLRAQIRTVDIPDNVDLDRHFRATAQRSLTAVIFGDPAPGQSALDKKRMGVEP